MSGLQKIIPYGICKFYFDGFATIIKISDCGQQYFFPGHILNQNDALQKAKFIMKKFFLLNCDNACLVQKSNELQVKFFDVVDGLRNYSFAHCIVFDKNYNLSRIIYYDVRYKKIGTYNLKPFSLAIKSLPANFLDTAIIKLNSCQLVYMYSESILQPVYLFSGVSNKGENLSYVVKALRYN